MDIEKIVKSATAIATLEFQENIKKEFKRSIEEDDLLGIWAKLQALEKSTPKLIESILTEILCEIYKEESNQ